MSVSDLIFCKDLACYECVNPDKMCNVNDKKQITNKKRCHVTTPNGLCKEEKKVKYSNHKRLVFHLCIFSLKFHVSADVLYYKQYEPNEKGDLKPGTTKVDIVHGSYTTVYCNASDMCNKMYPDVN